jgi:EAL domain-containing protein (putative c-di-GMP-specific phosphodiesterase class I)
MVREHDLDVPVILNTGQPDVETATRAVEYGAFRYLFKPVPLAVLADAVGHAVRWHEMARAKRQAFESGDGRASFLGDRAALDNRFDAAIGSLWIAYQPVVRANKREIFGYEALVRSDSTTLAAPIDLFSVAEQVGRLHELGRAIRARIAGDAALAPPRAALLVNLHAQDLNDPELTAPGAPLSRIAERVILEVTERSRLDSVQGIVAKVAALRQLGFRVAVDDLGAGYAGLSSFVLLEPDLIKIDMSLVRGIDASRTKQTIVQSMLRLAADQLGLSVICEGVETQAEHDKLVALGAELFQGNLFGQPGRGFATP